MNNFTTYDLRLRTYDLGLKASRSINDPLWTVDCGLLHIPPVLSTYFIKGMGDLS